MKPIERPTYSNMPRMFIVFRTFDRLWDNAMYTREFAPLEMDTGLGGIQLVFQADQISDIPLPGSQVQVEETTDSGKGHFSHDVFYTNPHRGHAPLFFGQKNMCLRKSTQSSSCCQSFSVVSPKPGVASLPNDTISRCFNAVNPSDAEKSPEITYFVLPVNKCTLVVDAHVAASLKNEYFCSRAFRRRLYRKIRRSCGFRNCMPDYQKWTQEDQDSWENYLSIPFMLDVVAVWPWQKVDHAWNDRILNLFNKHVVLEESLAWLSTLGGAHSSLGETFISHAERAGEISMHQMQLARELGNEVMIARCYLYWAWSLLQRDYLTRCKICILNTWHYVQKMKCCDKILINMCRAVWSRLQYKRSLKAKVKCLPGSKDHGRRDPDNFGCGLKRKGKGLRLNSSYESSNFRMQSVKVF